MTDNDYYYDRDHMLCWKPEFAFGESNEADSAKDETNDATDVYFPLPILLTQIPRFYVKRGRYYRKIANGGADWGFLANQGYSEGMVKLSGELIDLNMLLQLTTAITNSGATDAGTYTADTCASVSGNVVTMTGNSSHAADLFKWKILADTTDSKYYLITANSVSSTSVITFTVTPTPPASIAGNTCDVFDPGVHTYATSTARASPSATPTFNMLYKMSHVDAANANDLPKLYTGAVFKIAGLHGAPGEKGGPIICDLDILFRNNVVGTNLTTPGWPKQPTLKPFTFDRTSVSYSKGGVEYPGKCTAWDIYYNDGKALHKSTNELYPAECLLLGREISVDLTFAPKSKAHWDDTIHSPLAPDAASDIDITIKMYRDSAGTLNYEQWAFEKLWAVEHTDPEWSAFDAKVAQNTTTFILKPTNYETGAKLTITQSNHYKTNPYANGA